MAGPALQCGGREKEPVCSEAAYPARYRKRRFAAGWIWSEALVKMETGLSAVWGPGGGCISQGGEGAEKSLPLALSSCVTQSPPLSSQGPCLPRTVGSHQLPGGCRESTNSYGASAHFSLPRLGGHAVWAGAAAAQDPTGSEGLRDGGTWANGLLWAFLFSGFLG